MSSDSESSVCSYLYSSESNFLNNESCSEKSFNSGTSSSGRYIASDIRKRRGHSESPGHFKRFRANDDEYPSSGSSSNEGEEEEEETRTSCEKDEGRYRRGNEKGKYSTGECNTDINVVAIDVSLDEEIPSPFNYDIRDFELSLLEEQTVRGQETSTYVDGLPTVCTENVNHPEERVRQVFIKEFSEHPIKQRVVHDIFGTKYNYGDIHLDHEQLH